MNINKMLNNTDLVKDILINHPKARNDDDLLYEYVLNKYNISAERTSIRDIHIMVKNKIIPSHYTISRCRRKVQELYTELKSFGEVAKIRKQQEPDYKIYNIRANLKYKNEEI